MITAPTVQLISRPEIDWGALDAFLEANGKPRVEESIRSAAALDLDPGLVLVEASARICYDSYAKGRTDIEDFIRNLLSHKDGSVLEHVNYTFAISGISRSLSHELVRHRAGFAYSQRSQRFVDESGCAFVIPPLLLEHGTPEDIEQFESNMRDRLVDYSEFADALEQIAPDDGYPRATEKRKAVRSAARSVLPNATETKMIVTGNVRAWRHFIEMRASEFADAEIHRLAFHILRILQEEAPLLFNDFSVIHRGGRTVAVPEFSKV